MLVLTRLNSGVSLGHALILDGIFFQAAIQSTNDRVQYNDLQSLLCATLQVSANLINIASL